jgi:hypothetical protein
MARVRYIGPEPVTVPELGRTVELDEVVEVPDSRFEGYVCQPATWASVEEPKPSEPVPVKKTAVKAAPKGSDD